MALRRVEITSARAGPLSSEDQSLGLSVPGVCSVRLTAMLVSEAFFD